jgi:hypothetical protein
VIPGSRDSTFGVLQRKGIATDEIAIPRFLIEWREEVTWRGDSARAPGVRVSEVCGVRGSRHFMCRFPDREIPDKQKC